MGFLPQYSTCIYPMQKIHPTLLTLGNINSNTFAQHIISALKDEGNITVMLIYTAGAKKETLSWYLL